jgi:hypothetical protein
MDSDSTQNLNADLDPGCQPNVGSVLWIRIRHYLQVKIRIRNPDLNPLSESKIMPKPDPKNNFGSTTIVVPCRTGWRTQTSHFQSGDDNTYEYINIFHLFIVQGETNAFLFKKKHGRTVPTKFLLDPDRISNTDLDSRDYLITIMRTRNTAYNINKSLSMCSMRSETVF